MKRFDLTGMVFGRLTAVKYSHTHKRVAYWLCQCECGNTTTVASWGLRKATRSCGCLMRETSALISRTHGMSKTRTYRSWLSMRRRCNDPNSHQYKWYGGRGITVCKQWESFENFFTDMGERPPKMTIERKNHNGNYEPDNCYWANQQTQMNNTRKNRLIEFRGEVATLAEWSRKLQLPYAALQARLDKCNWTVEETFTTPLMTPQQSAVFRRV